MAKDASGRVALVSGGNRGIGLEICRGLARLGVHVVLGSRDPMDGEAARRDILDSEAGSDAWVRVEMLDVGDRRSVSEMKERLFNDGVHVDILVNNAAVYPEGTALDVPIDQVELAWRVNVLGPWLLIQTFVPDMVERGYGRIVNVSSGSGALAKGGDPRHAAYGVSKTALNGLTVNLACVVPEAVKVNTMCPGWVHTRMGGTAAPRTPTEGADTAVWLATLDDEGPTGGFFRDRKSIQW